MINTDLCNDFEFITKIIYFFKRLTEKQREILGYGMPPAPRELGGWQLYKKALTTVKKWLELVAL
jgi:hypothetical protein